MVNMSARERLLTYLQNDANKPLTAKELYDRFKISADKRNEFKDLL